MMKNTRHLFACQMLYRLSYRRNLYVVRLRGLEPPTLWFQQLVKLLIVSFKSSRLVACSFPSDMRRRSSRTMSSNSFSFTVTSLLKMCRFLGSHAIHSILGYVACLFSMVPYACVVLHASSFKRKTLHACCRWVPHSTMRRWASHWQNPSKRSRPINLWELNPLDLAYQANS